MVTPRPGTHIGHYQVLAPLGAGGMGEVYRAHDTKLGRDVALKLLRPEFAGDADRLSRFHREARVLASLNHRHIGQIYGVEESEGAPCLVLELVEGESLDEQLRRGPIALKEALNIARQIAEAVEASHSAGIMHRDLKPANIKRTATGEVKVLDFGLGKIFEAPKADLSQSPTLLSGATQSHVLLGTLAYMSPEQLRGRSADERSDIWAFGCVLYELLTGKPAFVGDSAAHTMGAITVTDPDWSALPPSVSPNIRRLLRRCLQKDPARRLQHIGDARIEIEEELGAGGTESTTVAIPRRGFSRLWLPAAMGVLLGAAIAWGFVYSRRVPDDAPKMRLEITVPGRTDRTNAWMAISPNARQIVFEQNLEGKSQFWIRPLDSAQARPLPGTEDGAFPFWSPDSRSLAFFANGKLKRIEVDGGPAQVIADALNPRGGAWNSNGTILFNAASSGPLSRVSVDGSSPGTATELQKDQGSHRYPQFLPDGRHFIYFALGKPEVSGVYAGSLDGMPPKRILASDSQAVYAHPGYLLFLRQGVLLAQPFDLKKLEVTGEPLPQAERVATGFTGWMFVSAADNGTIAYGTGRSADARMTWFDRSGKEAGTFGPVGGWSTVDLSPDGMRVASAKTDSGNGDIWMIEVARGIATRLTSDPADDEDPRWANDGMRIGFDSNRKGAFDLYEMNVSNIGKETALVESGQTKIVNSWSPDGRYILFGTTDEKTGGDLWARPLVGDPSPLPVVVRDYVQLFGCFSPDNQWIAYESNETGRPEIYVQSFTGPSERLQVSLDGGSDPRWSGNGKEIFFLAPDRMLMASAVTVAGKQIRSEPPVPLFPTSVSRPHAYDVSHDGQRFLMPIAVDKTTPPITILLNWAGR